MMQFDWTTFILEMLNFLVLVWILQRFLYRPVLAMLDARQHRINEESAHAEQLCHEAETLRLQYEQRLAEWQQQQDASRRQLDEQLAELRKSSLDALKRTLADEEAKLQAQNQRVTANRETALMREAASAAYAQAAFMLQRLATPQLTRSIVELFVEDLQALPDSEQAALSKAAAALTPESSVEVLSGHALTNAEQVRLSQALSMATGRVLSLLFKQDEALIAGVRVTVGECLLHANLADELAFFRRQHNHG